MNEWIQGRLIVPLLRSLGKLGVRVSRSSHALPYRRMRFIREMRVNVVLDGGANTGQYAYELSRLGYDGKIISFEPLSRPFGLLKSSAGRAANHDCWQIALGNFDGNAEIFVSENIVSSSLLTVHQETVRACPPARAIGAETVQVHRLDSIQERILKPTDRVHLKLDTQGNEVDVLRGAAETLRQTVSLEVEMSLVPVYQNQLLMTDVIEFLRARDFRCVWIEPGFIDEVTGHMLQVDGFFVHEPPDTGNSSK